MNSTTIGPSPFNTSRSNVLAVTVRILSIDLYPGMKSSSSFVVPQEANGLVPAEKRRADLGPLATQLE
jgi:hypothetical protein